MDPNKDNPPAAANIPTPPADKPVMPEGAPLPTPTPVAPSTGMPASPQVTQASKGSNKTMMMAAIVILILAILGVGGYILYQSQTGSKPPSTENTTDNSKLDEINEEVKSIEVTDPNTGFVQVDQEITALDATPSAASSSGTAR